MNSSPYNVHLVLAFAACALFAAPAVGNAQQLCSNTCASAFDGECDDGGPDSQFSNCSLGTDCNDCGPRNAAAAPPTPNPNPVRNPNPPVTGNTLCTNTCAYANDSECDDGGPNSLYDLCEFGSDCNDCGPRSGAGAPTPPPTTTGTGLCTNTCAYANDSECDDGGPGSLYDLCELGSDCNDCGPRDAGAGGTTQRAQAQHGSICVNTCSTANDNECDDGGPNSLYSICTYGSDCNDCGARPPMPGCTNSCATANDNECDDGGPNSLYSICDLGTDCADCGPR